MAVDPKITAGSMLLEDLVGMAWLYEVEVPTDPPTRVRLTSWTTRLYFGTYGASASTPGAPIPYYPASIKHSPIRESAAGDIPGLRVTVGNARRTASDLLETHRGLRGQPAKIMLVRIDSLDDTAAKVEWRFRVDRAGVKEDSVTLDLSRGHLNRMKDPPYRYLANGCRYPEFGGSRCGYIIPSSPGETVGTGFSTCPKSYAACVERGADEAARGVTVRHPLRFGGKRGLPRS